MPCVQVGVSIGAQQREDAEAEDAHKPTPLRLSRWVRTAASWAADAPDAAQPAGEVPGKRKRGNKPKYVYGTQAEVVAHRCGPAHKHNLCPTGACPELPLAVARCCGERAGLDLEFDTLRYGNGSSKQCWLQAATSL